MNKKTKKYLLTIGLISFLITATSIFPVLANSSKQPLIKDSPSVSEIIPNQIVPTDILYSQYTMKQGEVKKIGITITPENAMIPELEWNSSDPNVVSVTKDGTLTAIKNGKSIIHVSSPIYSNLAFTFTVTVGTPSTNINVNKSSITLDSGNTFLLSTSLEPKNSSSKTIVYESSDSSVASIDANGYITAKKAGTILISVNAKDSRSHAEVSVTVKPLTEPLIITSDVLKNDMYQLSNLAYEQVYIDASVNTSKINFKNVSVNDLTIDNTSVCNLSLANCTISNLHIESPTDINTIKKMNTETSNQTNCLHITGSSVIENLNVASTSAIMFDIAIQNLFIAKNAANSNITLKQFVENINNQSDHTSFYIYSKIQEINSFGNNTLFDITSTALINNFTTNGKNTNILGKGKIESLNINGDYTTIGITDCNIKTKDGVVGTIYNTGSDVNSTVNNTTNNNHSSDPITSNQIVSVESIKNGKIRVILSKASTNPLTINDFSIHCPAGRKMTIISISQVNGTTYDLNTAYFADDTYTLSINIDSITLSKTFESRYNCPNVSSQLARRISTTTAQIEFTSDERGVVYYIAVPNTTNQSSLLAYANSNFTWSDIKSNAIANNTYQTMEKGANTIYLTNLQPSSYDFYFVVESTDGRISNPITIMVPADATSVTPTAIQIVSATALNKQQFEMVLSEAINETITKDNIVISCPASSNLTLGTIETKDQKVFIINMKENYFYLDGNHYTITLTLQDGSSMEYTLYSNYSAPSLTNFTYQRETKEQTTVIFESNKAGQIYYTTSIADYDAKPDLATVLSLTPLNITQGVNTITVDSSAYDSAFFFCYVTKNNLGHTLAYVDSSKVDGKISSPSTLE